MRGCCCALIMFALFQLLLSVASAPAGQSACRHQQRRLISSRCPLGGAYLCARSAQCLPPELPIPISLSYATNPAKATVAMPRPGIEWRRLLFSIGCFRHASYFRQLKPIAAAWNAKQSQDQRRSYICASLFSREGPKPDQTKSSEHTSGSSLPDIQSAEPDYGTEHVGTRRPRHCHSFQSRHSLVVLSLVSTTPLQSICSFRQLHRERISEALRTSGSTLRCERRAGLHASSRGSIPCNGSCCSPILHQHSPRGWRQYHTPNVEPVSLPCSLSSIFANQSSFRSLHARFLALGKHVFGSAQV